MRDAKSPQLVAPLVVFAIAFMAFLPAVGNDFVNFDDPLYVTANRVVQRGLTVDGVRWAFTTVLSGNWHPLTWLSHMLDVELFGDRAAGHHLTGILLHALTSAVLCGWLASATGARWRSALAATLFAVHPLRVESVAWVAERKDLLCALFGVLALAAFTHWTRSPRRRMLLVALLCHVLSLAAKPMLVTLPLLLLLLDYWPLGRRLPLAVSIREKAPFFLIAGVAAGVALYAQQAGGALVALERLAPLVRAGNALTSAVAYAGQAVWPQGLAVFYPYPDLSVPWWRAVGSLSLLAAIGAVAVAWRSRPWLLVGWAWYLTALLPVIGLVQIGGQAMADRYTYLPHVGLFLIAAWAAADLVFARPRLRPAALVAAAAAVATLAGLTQRQIGYWKDSRTLFTRALAVTRDNWLAHYNLAVALAAEGRFADAVGHYEQTLRIKPDYALAHNNLGVALVQLARQEEAVRHFTRALSLDPRREDAHYNLGLILADQGRTAEAVEHLRAAVALSPEHAEARNNLGTLLARRGERAAAREQFVEALRLKPGLVEARDNLERLERSRAGTAPRRPRAGAASSPGAGGR